MERRVAHGRVKLDNGKNRGLTLGKFAPLHKGHQLVIETALAEMDEVISIIYDAPKTTSVFLRYEPT